MNEQLFVERRDHDWRRLKELCDLAERGLPKLSGEELRELISLYRRVSTDLATARTRSSNLGLIDFLNDLSARAYSLLYRAPRASILETLLQALVRTADTVRRRRWFVFTSIAVFFGSALFAFFILNLVPDSREALVPSGAEEMFQGWKSGTFEDRTGSDSAMMTGFYASNNPKVAIIAGAVGAGSFGFISIFLNYQNGAMMGVLAHEVNEVGNLDFLLSSVTPHGVPEISGLVFSCSSGLLLGWALINPGRRRRGEALREVGSDAIVLLGLSVVMMFIAAPIEGFFSFNPAVPGGVKVAVATLELAGWLAFWTYFGRKPTVQSTP